jgi:hypothetical protein
MDWIDLAEDRNQWRALVITAMNLREKKNLGSSRAAELLAVSQEELSSLELVAYYRA